MDGRGPGIGGDDEVEDRVVRRYAGKGDDCGEEYDYELVNMNTEVWMGVIDPVVVSPAMGYWAIEKQGKKERKWKVRERDRVKVDSDQGVE